MNNWLQKLGFGLKKSSSKITSNLNNIFNKQKIDAKTIEDLEEVLLNADIGIQATNKIISNFAKKRIDKDTNISEIKQTLASDIENILQPCEQKLVIQKPQNAPFPYICYLLSYR